MKDKKENNKHLVKKVLDNNSKAFEELIFAYQRLVCHIVYRVISNDEDREDIVQDVFVKIYNNLSDFNFDSKLSTWIAKIAYNTSINYLRKRKVSLINDISAEEDALNELSTDEAVQDSYVEKKDTFSRIQFEIEKLPVRYRSILTLYHLDEMTYNEIGEVMNMPEGTVKNYIFRARKLLKDRLVSKYKREEL